jgi:methylthioribulose-1-phosphate dehydratase
MTETSTAPALDSATIEAGVSKLQNLARDFHTRSWSLATSGNFSIVLSQQPLRLLMTASGKDKSCLCADDFVVLDESLEILKAASNSASLESLRPSAEAALHAMIVEQFHAGAVLHTHSIWSTILSDKRAGDGEISFNGWEMQKALRGINTHESSVTLPIFPNDQNMHELAETVKQHKHKISHGFLLVGHGLYTWGANLEEAKRHVEALEFLLEISGRTI